MTLNTPLIRIPKDVELLCTSTLHDFVTCFSQNLTGIKGLSEAKVDKICEAAEKLVVSICNI